MLFIDDDEPNVAKRREERGARADDDVRVPAAHEIPLVVALPDREARMLPHHAAV